MNSTVRQLEPSAAGFTHASSVIPFERSREFASATVTQLEEPLNDNAPPNLPATLHVAPLIVPLFPFPERSASVVPVPALKEYAATSPGGGGGGGGGAMFETVTETVPEPAEFPAASRALALSEWEPLAAVAVSQETE